MYNCTTGIRVHRTREPVFITEPDRNFLLSRTKAIGRSLKCTRALFINWNVSFALYTGEHLFLTVTPTSAPDNFAQGLALVMAGEKLRPPTGVRASHGGRLRVGRTGAKPPAKSKPPRYSRVYGYRRLLWIQRPWGGSGFGSGLKYLIGQTYARQGRRERSGNKLLLPPPPLRPSAGARKGNKSRRM